jgi:hypothetical protein
VPAHCPSGGIDRRAVPHRYHHLVDSSHNRIREV